MRSVAVTRCRRPIVNSSRRLHTMNRAPPSAGRDWTAKVYTRPQVADASDATDSDVTKQHSSWAELVTARSTFDLKRHSTGREGRRLPSTLVNSNVRCRYSSWASAVKSSSWASSTGQRAVDRIRPWQSRLPAHQEGRAWSYQRTCLQTSRSHRLQAGAVTARGGRGGDDSVHWPNY